MNRPMNRPSRQSGRLSNRWSAVAGAAVLLPVLAGCGGDDAAEPGAAAPSASPGVTGTVTVFAAASLSEAFTQLSTDFTADNPGAEVKFTFGPSSGLATQLVEGAPADVFAAASAATMKTAADAKAVGTSTVFARNALQIAVPADNPAKITALADLAKPDVKVALCQPQVPCGTVAKKVLDAAELTVTPVTLEVDVKATLTKVRLGEVDAGLVYVTDVIAAGSEVKGIDIEDDVNSLTDYPIAVATEAPNAAAAQAFVDYVTSEEGFKVLEQAGFTSPS